jgi:hypothetical protein
MNWALQHWHWILLAGLALVVLGRFSRRRKAAQGSSETREQTDARDPLRRWCQAAARLITRDCDYGYLPRGEARRMLQRWWHVHGTRDLTDTLRELGDSDNPDNAWELLRFILVSRLGAAAEMLDDDDAWGMIEPLALRLQDAYDDWAAMAQAYVTARRQWQGIALDGSQDDDTMRWVTDNLQSRRAGLWTEVRWDLDLENP